MDLKNATLAPTKLSDRIQSLDIMRGIVVFGILIMNINGMGLARAYDNPSVSGGVTGWDLITWITANMFFEGTMRALFSLLFGVGMFIFLDRLEKKGAGIEATNIYFRRLLWLLIFGLIHGYILLWEGEILYNYALMGFVIFSFRLMNPKKLIFITLLLLIGGFLWGYFEHQNDLRLVEQATIAEEYKALDKPLSKELDEALEKWETIQEEKSSESIADYNENMRKNYFSVMGFLAPIITHENEHFPYRHDWYDVLGMMLLGIAFFKMNILSAEKSFRFYGIMAIIGYSIGLTVNYYETKLIIDSGFSFLGISKSYLTYELGRIPVSLGHIAMIMLFCKMPILNWLKTSLSAVGKMALTNYVMHSVFALFIFTGAGFGLFGKLHRHELMYIVFSIWIFQLIISPIWLKYFYFGPLEWIWRNLSYQKKYVFRK
ncbi:DUF418 domain-containing protein [Tamlana flava]|uniref:DUF418 domain-containing protein n=1 Tax=Tamlana flava TaxID=3158572 RepID=UPI00351B848C